MPAVHAHDLSKSYGSGHTRVDALKHATFSLGDGEFLALVGPSGSGKTTLLTIVGALLEPTSGEVIIGDRDITRLSGRERTAFRARQIGFVFQSFNLVPFLTARENLTVMSSIARLERAEVNRRADRLLQELDIDARRDNLPEQLSGGERQRVAIGRALVTDPALILVDEPTASLDTTLGSQVVRLLGEEIKKRGKSGIMVTHDSRMADFTDRTITILDGVLTDGEARAGARARRRASGEVAPQSGRS
ncbi:ATP-binding cassette domain-containing protein [Acidimicrobiaceae bacterium USS-CC1]|uniref:Putative hemin import ATP-binding protein HrtA n=1 Tax=Acidiferrimicrobium australe TaxID=2664430 RepID=A0ABW9QVG3_9ACTN|nr:ATP-binding cassette domain-containing protein [Acidiferrimicrobium australe]